MNPLLELHELGQSIWLDFITRKFMTDGKLARLITEDGLCGVTSNPTIFQKAITGGQEYDAVISRLIREGKTSGGFGVSGGTAGGGRTFAGGGFTGAGGAALGMAAGTSAISTGACAVLPECR